MSAAHSIAAPLASPALALGIAAVAYIAQVWLSAWWLGRYHFGPMEWLWRSLTYGRAQPMRISSATAARLH